MIGRAEADGIGVAQRAVKRPSSGGARDHADLERESVPVCDLGERRYHFGISLAVPAGVKPLNPAVRACSTIAAASSGRSAGKG